MLLIQIIIHKKYALGLKSSDIIMNVAILIDEYKQQMYDFFSDFLR